MKQGGHFPLCPDTLSYIYIAVQTAHNIIDANRNTKAQLIQQRLSTYWK